MAEVVVADLGAQVLSVVVADDDHADAGGGGHGIRADALTLASDEARRMVDDGLLIEVDDGRLGETEERMLWEGIWKHHCSSNGRGLQSVLREYLDEADPDVVEFGTRVVAVAEKDDDGGDVGGFEVTAVRRPAPSSAAEDATMSTLNDHFDSVVICVPAPDVISMRGLESLLPTWGWTVLHSVGYDSRCAAAAFYRASDLRPRLEGAFGDRIELALDFPDPAPPGSARHGVHMLMWQDAKHRRRPRTEVEDYDDDAVVAPSSGLCSVTMHTRVDVEREMTAEDVEDRLHAAVADLVGMTPEDVRSLAVGGTKVVRWQVAQMIRPKEAVMDPVPNAACIVSCVDGGGTSGMDDGRRRGRLVVAGDFMTQSSFLGCVTSASEASDAVISAIEAREHVRCKDEPH